MSRNDARSRGLLRRPSRTVPASITAVVLAAGGGLALAGAGFRLAQGSWPAQLSGAAQTVVQTSWSQPLVITGGAVAVVLGLVLLVAAWKPGAPTSARLATPPGSRVSQTDFVISRRGVARLASATADQVDGVERVTTSASGRRVHLRVTTASEQTDQIRQRLVEVVGTRLREAGLDPAPRVSASVRTRAL